MRRSLWIDILSTVDENAGITLLELKERLELDEGELRSLVQHIHQQDIFKENARASVLHIPDRYSEIILIMSLDDKFRLLEYQELKEARQSSKIATRFATAALAVSIFVGIFSIYFSYQTMNPEVDHLKSIDKNLSLITKNVKLSTFISASKK